MSYVKRYAGGFVDLPATTTPIDSAFLNAVETALLKLQSVDPTADGQVLQWDNANTRFGPALLLNKNIDAAAAIDKSKLNLAGQITNADIAAAAAIDASKINFGSTAAGRGFTIGTFAAGPPATPNDGDIWIATGVDANGTRWQFQYNAGSASAYKWEFIGGAPLNAQSVAATVLSNGGTWITNNQLGCQVSLARGGDYLFTTAFWGVGAAGTPGQQEIGVSIGGAAPTVATSEAVSPASGGFTMAGGLVLTGLATNTLANLAYLSNSNASAGWRSLTAVPVRIA